MITKKTANNTIKTPINTVVPHPGNTFPASEFNGLNNVPNVVDIPGSFNVVAFDFAFEVIFVAIVLFSNYIDFFYFLEYSYKRRIIL